MNEDVYEHLIETARSGGVTTYGAVSGFVNVNPNTKVGQDALKRIFEEIAEHETKEGRPLLVVVVVRSDTNMPGKGLFTWAKARGLQADDDDIKFFSSELRRVHDYWKSAPR